MIPILIVGDAPNRQTGLARIARELCALLYQDQVLLGIRVAQLGLNYDGSPWPWRVYPVHDTENWAQEDLPRVWDWHAGKAPGIVFSIWDPGRCYGVLLSKLHPVVERWGYFAIDGCNRFGSLGGPAAEVIGKYDRVLAYGRWGSKVLRSLWTEAVPYLPHGLTSVFSPGGPSLSGPNWDPQRLYSWESIHATKWISEMDIFGDPKAPLVGAVAANQPRKDWGMTFEAFMLMKQRISKLRFWVHIDKQVTSAWSISQLAIDFGLNDPDTLLVTTDLTDAELAAMYSSCSVTIAPGLGEGFGYPIVESLACGTPVVHGDYAGGSELIPRGGWRFVARTTRLEGAYAITRPVYSSADVARAAWTALDWKNREPEVVREFCRGAVAHLRWEVLWPRWRSYFRRELSRFRDETQGTDHLAVV